MIFLHKQDKVDSKEVFEKVTVVKEWKIGEYANTKSSGFASSKTNAEINTWRRNVKRNIAR